MFDKILRLMPLYVGWARAVESCTLCETWSAHLALGNGWLNGIAPVLKVDGEFIPNPMVHTDASYDAWGRPQWGLPKTGDALVEAKALLKSAEVDFALLDAEVESLAARLSATMPDCTTYTLENLRRHKLAHWDRNREGNRAWLALNMMTEALAGFRTFNRVPRDEREADFLEMRRALAEGASWNSPDFLSRFAPYAEDKS